MKITIHLPSGETLRWEIRPQTLEAIFGLVPYFAALGTVLIALAILT